MDARTTRTEISGTNCHVCGHFGTSKCDFEADPQAACDSFLSWSDLWQREMAAIKRAHRATYLLAAAATLLAIVVMLLPSLWG